MGCGQACLPRAGRGGQTAMTPQLKTEAHAAATIMLRPLGRGLRAGDPFDLHEQ
jgi:hypothetical protein